MLPNKKVRKAKKVHHVCQYPDCNKEFYAVKVAKYCEQHRTKKYSNKLYKKPSVAFDIKEVEKENIYLKHDNFKVEIYEFNCACCNEPYRVKILPRLYIYPKFCPEHRNSYKRELFQKNH